MYNTKENKFYVILADGRIESGWEDREDAKDQIENIPPKFQKGTKVLTLTGIKNKNIDPDDDKNWADNIMKESKFDKLYESIMKEIKTVDNSHILKELNKTLNAFEEIADGFLSAEDGKDYVKYFTEDLKNIDDLLENYGKGGSSLTKNMKLTINELNSLVEDLENDEDVHGTEILKAIKDEFEKLKKELSSSHAM